MTKLNGDIQTKRDYNRNESPRQHYCQGLCDNLKVPRPAGNPYKKGLVLCARCDDDAWMPKEIMKPHPTKGIVCPCCNFRPRTKTRKYGKAKEEYVRY